MSIFSIPQCTALFSSKERVFTNNNYEENAQEVNDNVATWLENDIAGCHMFDSLFHVDAENTFDINIIIAFVKQNATKFNQDGTRLMPLIHFWELLAEHQCTESVLQDLSELMKVTVNKLLQSEDDQGRYRLVAALTSFKGEFTPEFMDEFVQACFMGGREGESAERRERRTLMICLWRWPSLGDALSLLFKSDEMPGCQYAGVLLQEHPEYVQTVERFIQGSSAEVLAESDFARRLMPAFCKNQLALIKNKLKELTAEQLGQLLAGMVEYYSEDNEVLQELQSLYEEILAQEQFESVQAMVALHLREVNDCLASGENHAVRSQCSTKDPLAHFVCLDNTTETVETGGYWYDASHASKIYEPDWIPTYETRTYNYDDHRALLRDIVGKYSAGMRALITDEAFQDHLLGLNPEQHNRIHEIMLLPVWVFGEGKHFKVNLQQVSESFSLQVEYARWVDELRLRALDEGKFEIYLQLSLRLSDMALGTLCVPFDIPDRELYLSLHFFTTLTKNYYDYVVNGSAKISDSCLQSFCERYIEVLALEKFPDPLSVSNLVYKKLPDRVVVDRLPVLFRLFDGCWRMRLMLYPVVRQQMASGRFSFDKETNRNHLAWFVALASYFQMFYEADANPMLGIIRHAYQALGQNERTLDDVFDNVQDECRSIKNPNIWRNDPTKGLDDISEQGLSDRLNVLMYHFSQQSIEYMREVSHRPGNSLRLNQLMLVMGLLHWSVQMDSGNSFESDLGGEESRVGQEVGSVVSRASMFKSFVSSLPPGQLEVVPTTHAS